MVAVRSLPLLALAVAGEHVVGVGLVEQSRDQGAVGATGHQQGVEDVDLALAVVASDRRLVDLVGLGVEAEPQPDSAAVAMTTTAVATARRTGCHVTTCTAYSSKPSALSPTMGRDRGQTTDHDAARLGGSHACERMQRIAEDTSDCAGRPVPERHHRHAA